MSDSVEVLKTRAVMEEVKKKKVDLEVYLRDTINTSIAKFEAETGVKVVDMELMYDSGIGGYQRLASVLLMVQL